MAATAISWEVGHGLALAKPRYASVAVIVVAFVKARFVILDFMELRTAPPPVRIVAEIWVGSICLALIAMYLIAPT